MSVETDVAEIKAIVKGLESRMDENIQYNKTVCILKHKTIDTHLDESQPHRDKISKLDGMMRVVLTLVSVLMIGILGIAFFVIQKVFAGN